MCIYARLFSIYLRSSQPSEDILVASVLQQSDWELQIFFFLFFLALLAGHVDIYVCIIVMPSVKR